MTEKDKLNVAFVEYWMPLHRLDDVSPTYADAMLWMKEKLINKACDWLDRLAVYDREEFCKAMEE